jgi:hypothetical protein
MVATEVKHRPLLSEPIVIEENPEGPVPFLTRFPIRPEIRVPDIRMGNQTYLGVTSPGVGDYANDDQ